MLKNEKTHDPQIIDTAQYAKEHEALLREAAILKSLIVKYSASLSYLEFEYLAGLNRTCSVRIEALKQKIRR